MAEAVCRGGAVMQYVTESDRDNKQYLIAPDLGHLHC